MAPSRTVDAQRNTSTQGELSYRRIRNVPEPRDSPLRLRLGASQWEIGMAKEAKKQTTRGRKQGRARVAGGQKYEVSYEAKKTGRSAPSVKKAVKKVGNVR
jgi:hypothetical protein